MNDVHRVELKALAEFRVSYPFRGAIEPVVLGPTFVLQMKDIYPNKPMNWTDVVRTELTSRRVPDWAEAGDLVLVTRGNRYHAKALESVPYPTITGPHLYHLRVSASGALLPEFLAWQFNQPPIQRQLRLAAEGSNQLSIRRAELEALVISVPSLEDQRRIVRIVNLASSERAALERLIRNRERQMENLAFDLAAQAIPETDSAPHN